MGLVEALKGPNLAVYRFEKFTGPHWRQKVAEMIGHNGRTIPTLNADPSIKNQIVYGPPLVQVLKACEAKIAQHRHPKGHKLRRNQVYAYEHIVTASKAYFLVDGERDTSKISSWSKATVTWLQREFGDNLISAVLHLDEDVPHIHAISIPLVDNQLLAVKITGSPRLLRGLQDRYAAAVVHLGIQRGLPDSKARPIERQEFYSRVKRALEPAKLPPVMEVASLKLSDFKNPMEAIKKLLKRQHAAICEHFKRIIAPYKAKAEAYDLLMKNYEGMRSQNMRMRKCNREINLQSVMSALGQEHFAVDNVSAIPIKLFVAN
jgi:hypothetical protein